jgi:hypothetical protein
VLPTVIFAVMVIAAVVGVMSLIARNGPYEDIAKGPFALDREGESGAGPLGGSAQAERELEIRQLLEARSARAIRDGGEPIDVEAELDRLLGRARGVRDAAR